MDRKSERLAKRIQKAGIRASIKEGHVLSEAELRNIKVQILPNPLRIGFFAVGVIASITSYYCFTSDSGGYGITLLIFSISMMFFGIFGVRRTLSRILDSMDVMDAAEVAGLAVKGIASAVGSLFDGL